MLYEFSTHVNILIVLIELQQIYNHTEFSKSCLTETNIQCLTSVELPDIYQSKLSIQQNALTGVKRRVLTNFSDWSSDFVDSGIVSSFDVVTSGNVYGEIVA